MKEFKVTAKFKLHRIKNESKLPKQFGSKEWYVLANWSNLKHPKKWKNSKRYQRKFNKNYRKYLPHSILDMYYTRGELRVKDAYEKAIKEIIEEEDKI